MKARAVFYGVQVLMDSLAGLSSLDGKIRGRRKQAEL
jgi:hypothetical protein